MLTTTIPSYLYEQFADDDDLQAFVDSFNQAMQTYVDWFNTVGLPFYPGLTGPLLDWVAVGLYGLPRTALATPLTPAKGPLNTQVLNTVVFNSFIPPVSTSYALSDDIFQRILTWNFYKGDGKRFCIRWLKRRIMRFLLGANGLNPLPTAAGFTIGTECTIPIDVQITSGTTVMVVINQSILSLLTAVAPGVLTLFQLAFQQRILDAPMQYNYVVTINTFLAALATPGSQASSGAATTQTTGTSAVSVSGGSGNYTYAWVWLIGGTGITINTAAVAATSFTATGMTAGTTYTGLAKCTVTDTTTTLTTTATVTVSITCTH